MGFLVLAAALHDEPGAAVPAFFVAILLTTSVFSWFRPSRSLTGAALCLLLAAAISGIGGELGERAAARDWLNRAAAHLEPGGGAAAALFEASIRRSLEAIDLDSLGPDHSAALDPRDLAVALWRVSPLKRANLASAVVVRHGGAAISSFSVGLPLTGGNLDSSPSSWHSLGLEGQSEFVRSGTVTLTAPGETSYALDYWFLPRPGFDLPTWNRAATQPWGIPLTDGPSGLPFGVRYGAFDPVGRVVVSPWSESSRLSPSLLRIPGARVRSGGAVREIHAASFGGGFQALVLDVRGPGAALDAAATAALEGLGPWVGIGLLCLAFGSLRPVAREALSRTVRSYSRRLVVVLSLIAVLPTLLIVAFGVRLVERHLAEEARQEGEAALSSARRVLGEYLETLEPGFSLGTTLDDRLLAWLSGVVRADVNLYWGSRVYASSRPELFTGAGLPGRLPGEVYARLAWVGDPLVTRRAELDDGQGLVELYAPLSLPGGTREDARLVLSVPRAQFERGLANEIGTLRRRALLLALTLMLLLAIVGRRLASGFTRPIQDLVSGTQRIAAGAASTGLAPGELELAALVQAIDRMAQRIAEARAGILAEKNLVETVVENIGAGVVTLDRAGRVVLCNRLARERLRIDLGDELLPRLATRGELAELADWVSERAAEPRLEAHRSVRLLLPEGDRDWAVGWVPIPGESEGPRAILVVEDVSEVVRGQRLQAWAEMARLIAHEIKNPLTPIRLSAEHLREVAERDPERIMPVLERCVSNILRQVDQLREIAGEFSTYSRIPEMQRERRDMREVVRAVAEGYALAPVDRPTVTAELPPLPVLMEVDVRLMERTLRNLVENSLRVSPANASVSIRLAVEKDRIRLEVADRGPGVPPHMLERIFEPYFSTHDLGTGLGLPIARQIVEAHGGRLEAAAREGGGLIVSATFSRSDA
jgi:nitrogen fixation/metabolism regulation signal transduction histidine kinase